MSTSNLRAVVRLAVLFSLVFALSVSQGWAGGITDIGSAAISRPSVDGAPGEVYIYDGGVFQNGETVGTFNWFGPTFSGSSTLTPLLLSESGGIFTIVGIGSVINETSGSGMSSTAFGLQNGSNVAGSNWTFGFLEGAATSTGSFVASTGGVPFVSPNDDLAGTQGSGNDIWVFTPSTTDVTTVGLGTSFGAPGANATYALNNSSLGSFNVDRTYSANADAPSGVAEPGTFSLITGAGLVLAGLFRYRYTRGRKS